jgi:hypothetical protein
VTSQQAASSIAWISIDPQVEESETVTGTPSKNPTPDVTEADFLEAARAGWNDGTVGCRADAPSNEDDEPPALSAGAF